ncbi:MAG: hypothetical protein GY786_20390, partial [Proteobacteria bacterium]|nr:hypothetical protein [Pseudomonadota bacterium]
MRSEEIKPQIKLATESMEPLFAPVFSSGDRIISSCKIKPDFNKYLDSLGINNARLKTPSKSKEGEKGEAWGWSEKAINQLDQWNYKLSHPSPECCRQVNSREFCSYISDKYSIGAPYSTLVNTREELLNSLDNIPFDQFVAKPLFGNAGAGFVFFSRDNMSQAI